MKQPKQTLPAFTPVPRQCNRHDGWTPERQRGFIEALADLGSVRAAANSMGMTPESAYQLRRHPEAKEFRKAWQAALDLGIQRIEDVAMERALGGVEVPVYAYGKIIGTRRVYNDALLMFMLRNRAPKRFAADGAKGMSAVDKALLLRLKKQWRKEWEKEWGALQLQREAETIASINAKIDRIREREEAAARLAERYRSGPDGEDGVSEEESEAEFWAEFDQQLPSPEMRKLLPGYVEPKDEEEDQGPRIRSMKNGGWD